jgi:hypothetical protein
MGQDGHGLGRDGLHTTTTGISSEQVRMAIADAQASWDQGRLAHVYLPRVPAGVKDVGLTKALEGIVGIGWSLQSPGIAINHEDMNSHQTLYVFTRPPYLG